jgi:pyruvate formate lyase activating enzyme
VPNHEGNHTYCHHCRRLVIARAGYFIRDIHLNGNCCATCGTAIPGIWA